MLFDSNFDGFNQGNIIKESFKDTSHLEEVFIADEVAHLPEEKIKEFCAPGGVGEALVAEGKISKKTLVRRLWLD